MPLDAGPYRGEHLPEGPYGPPHPGAYQDVPADDGGDYDGGYDGEYDGNPGGSPHGMADQGRDGGHPYEGPREKSYKHPHEGFHDEDFEDGDFDDGDFDDGALSGGRNSDGRNFDGRDLDGEDFDEASDQGSPVYEHQQGFDDDDPYDPYDPYDPDPGHGPGPSRASGPYHRPYPSDGRGGHPWHGSGAPPPGPDELPPYPAMPRARGLKVPSFLAKLPGGSFVSVVGVAAVLLLVLVVGTGWYVLRGDDGEPEAGAAGQDAGDGSATALQLKKSATAGKLFPKSITPVDRSKHVRAAVGEVPCGELPAGEAATKALDDLGCKKAYLALYVDKKKKYAVTVGYLNVGSKKKAKAGERKRYGDYPKYNTWFRFLVPDGSRVTKQTQVFTYVSSSGKYLTYGTGAHYDGRNAKDRLDEALMRETVAVGVAVGFTQ